MELDVRCALIRRVPVQCIGRFVFLVCVLEVLCQSRGGRRRVLFLDICGMEFFFVRRVVLDSVLFRLRVFLLRILLLVCCSLFFLILPKELFFVCSWFFIFVGIFKVLLIFLLLLF